MNQRPTLELYFAKLALGHQVWYSPSIISGATAALRPGMLANALKDTASGLSARFLMPQFALDHRVIYKGEIKGLGSKVGSRPKAFNYQTLAAKISVSEI